jgi:transposase
MSLFWLNDSQWQAVATALPKKQTGPKRSNDRTVISGIIHVLVSGCAWRECPREYGPFMTVFNRFNRWKHSRIWDRIAAALTSEHVHPPVLMPDGSLLSEATAARSRSPTQSPGARALLGPHRKDANNAWRQAEEELRKLAHAHAGEPTSQWVEAIVEWHMDSLFAEGSDKHNEAARDDKGQQSAVARLATEMIDLRLCLLNALACLQSYADDPVHNAAPTKARLRQLIKELTRPGASPEASADQPSSQRNGSRR